LRSVHTIREGLRNDCAGRIGVCVDLISTETLHRSVMNAGPCLAKIPSGDKMSLTPELGRRFGRGFPLGRGQSVTAERNNNTAKPAPRRQQTYAPRRLSSISLSSDRSTDSAGQIVAMMQTAESRHGFNSATMRRMVSRNSLLTHFPPARVRCRESQVQQSLNPDLCHRTTVSGWTRINARFHPSQSHRNVNQNNRSGAANLG
jgi:hypothetical protein